MNSAGISEFDELIGHVFPSFVILQFFDFRIELVFSSSLEQLEGLKCLALSLQVHGTSVGHRIIKECDPVAVSFTGGNRERTMQIRVGTSLSGIVERNRDDGNGLECILPARQGSQ